ncbi:hypothetical protein BDK51DRAFT_42511 [Blyttiomyces helicus]|uniref:Uncharacterized protein n=1 Tax=Blyttiomyces helicus TaxID=388810 RepID=A0A4P9WIZ6_9FUNG|nr:hypothetical protein BDK51DRAFT_42511 [Blyttiomyces helicus]|eukprot:RKO92332.1 hypothetical protein BDK51DRAFT_42511 [Blyttiomyces helicus]
MTMDLPALDIENVTDSQPIAGRTPNTCAAAPPGKTAPAKKAPHTNPPVKPMGPLTPSGKKAPVKKAPVRTKPAAITVKGKARKNLAWTDNIIINLYGAREEHLTEFTVGNVPSKGAWKLVLETRRQLVEDNDDPDTMIMLAIIEVETKHLVNNWAMVDKDTKAYFQNGGTTESGAADIPEPKFSDLYTDAMGDAVDVNGPAEHHHLDFIQSESLTLPPQKIKRSSAGAVALDDLVFGAEKESEVEKEDCENHTAENSNEDGIFDNEMEGDNDTQVTANCPPLLECQPTPETTLDDILAEAPSPTVS